MTENDLAKVILISVDKRIGKLVKFTLEGKYNMELDEFSKDDECIGTLNAISDVYTSIFYECEEEDEFLGAVIKTLSNLEKPIPLILISEERPEIKKEYKFPLLHVNKMELLDGLKEVVEFLYKRDDSKEPWEFTSVRISTLDIFENIHDDLYIQLPSGRYIKVFKGGDGIEDHDLKRYLDKGVEHLHLKQKTHKWVLQQVKENLPEFIKNKEYKFILLPKESDEKSTNQEGSPETNREAKAKDDINLQKVMSRVSDELVIQEDFKEQIEKRITLAIEKIKDHPKLKKPFKSLKLGKKPTNYLNGHVSLLVLASCGLAKLLGWDNEANLDKFVYASMLHDLSLVTHPHLSKIQDLEMLAEAKITKDEEKIFLNHASEMAKIVKSTFQFAPDETDLIILQHHERPYGKGFPEGLSSARIIPVAVLFIISHELVDSVLRHNEQNFIKLFGELEKKYNSANFLKVIHTIKLKLQGVGEKKAG